MKIRRGFVSNSSTSSFLIYGICVEEGEEKGLIGETEDFFESFEKILEGTNLEWHAPEECGIFIGLSWDGVKDDETGKQFKERVRGELEKVFGKKIKDFELGTHSYAWREG